MIFIQYIISFQRLLTPILPLSERWSSPAALPLCTPLRLCMTPPAPENAVWPGWNSFPASRFKNWLFPAFACGRSPAWRLNSAPAGRQTTPPGRADGLPQANAGNSTIFSQACGKRIPAGPNGVLRRRGRHAKPQRGTQGQGGRAVPSLRRRLLMILCLYIFPLA